MLQNAAGERQLSVPHAGFAPAGGYEPGQFIRRTVRDTERGRVVPLQGRFQQPGQRGQILFTGSRRVEPGDQAADVLHMERAENELRQLGGAETPVRGADDGGQDIPADGIAPAFVVDPIAVTADPEELAQGIPAEADGSGAGNQHGAVTLNCAGKGDLLIADDGQR